jgi:protein gp37
MYAGPSLRESRCADLELFLDERTLLLPLRWKKPRMIFVESMSDLFGDWVPDEQIDKIFAVMSLAGKHTFQVLTKRADRMERYIDGCVVRGAEPKLRPSLISAALRVDAKARDAKKDPLTFPPLEWDRDEWIWPPPNVWLGVSAEDQSRANDRIKRLMRTPAKVRFASLEPLLGPIDLSPWLPGKMPAKWNSDTDLCVIRFNQTPDTLYAWRECLSWVIVGGESGDKARPCRIEWVRSLVRQCAGIETGCFVKQLGGNIIDRNDAFGGENCDWPDSPAPLSVEEMDTVHQGADCRVKLRDKKGGDPQEWPLDLRVREMPEGRSMLSSRYSSKA